MALLRRTAHRSKILAVHLVHCRPSHNGCGPEECASIDSVAFPLRGVFLKHHSRRERVVADRCHALYFRAGEPYRVSHPAGCGDDCLSIELASQTVEELFGAETFPGTHALLDAPRLHASRRLVGRLADAPPLEIDERALALLAGASDAPPSEPASPRQRDMVEATRIALASQPEEPWSLTTLARRVHASPFYLARSFRRLTGMPLHRYHLRARLAAALDQVRDTSLDLTSIGVQLGFSSHSHFTAAFHRAFGATPSAVRKEGKILTAR
jgi:AraC-like DNA-binding protein